MTAPTRTLALVPRLPADAAFDAVAEGGALAAPIVDPRAGTRVDGAALQRMLGNQAVLRSRDGGTDKQLKDQKPSDGQVRIEKNPSSPAAEAADSDIPATSEPLPKVAEAAPLVPASPPVVPPKVPDPGPESFSVRPSGEINSMGDLQREVSRLTGSLPGLDGEKFAAVLVAQRAQGFRLSRPSGGASGAARQSSGGGAREAESDRPREPDPVPAQTKALVAIGSKKLPDVPLFTFELTPNKRVPVLGSRPLSNQEMMILKTTAKGEYAKELAEEDQRRIADRKAKEDAFNAAEAKRLEGEGKKAKGAKAEKFVDEGPQTFAEMRKSLIEQTPQPVIEELAEKKLKDGSVDKELPRYPEHEPPPPIVFATAQKEDVMRTLAGLQEDKATTAKQILSEVVKAVYWDGAIGQKLEAEFPEVGDPEMPEVLSQVDLKIGELQKGAGITDKELEAAVAARREELRLLRKRMLEGATQQQMDDERAAAGKTRKENAVLAAKKEAADIRAGRIKKSKPKLAMTVDARRDRLLGYVTEDVTALVVRFKQKGEIRDGLVRRMHADYVNAYRFAAQQDTYDITRKYDDPQLAIFGLARSSAAGKETDELSKWLDKRIKEVEEHGKKQKEADDAAVEALQKEARDLGDAKREAIRAWAEKRTGKKRTAEEKEQEKLNDQATQKQADAAAIEHLGHARLAAGVVNDFSVAQAIATEVQKGTDKATIIANLRLNAAQQAILDAYLKPGEAGDDRVLSAVMVGARERIRSQLQETLEPKIEDRILKDYGSDKDNWYKLSRIGASQRAEFNALKIAQKVHAALDKLDTDEDTVYEQLANLTKIQAQAIRLAYIAEYDTTIEKDLVGGDFYGMSGNELLRAQKLLASDQATADAIGYRVALYGNEGTWYNAINPFSTADIDALDKINHGKTLEERQKAEDAYNIATDDELARELADLPPNVESEKDPKRKAELVAEYRKSVIDRRRASGKSQLVADADASLRSERQRERFHFSVAGKDEENDALALRDVLPTPAERRKFKQDMNRAGHPEMGDMLVADRKKVEAIYDRIRREAKSRGDREHWTSDQVEAEIARRIQSVEGIFNGRFGTDYENASGSALRAAFAVGFHKNKDEANLANALADNDLNKADAARVQSEHRGTWATDDVLNAVLAQQYQRALESKRRDELPLRRMIMARQMADIETKTRKDAYDRAIASRLPDSEARRRADEAWTGDKQWEVRERLQREIDRTIEDAAVQQAKGNMNGLRDAYHRDYGGNLDDVVLSDTSGYDNQKAAALLKQNGRLTLGQTMFYAIRGVGTDEEALNALKGHTKAEINIARQQFRELAIADRSTFRGVLNFAWDPADNDLDMDSEIMDDISGRTGFDVSQMLKGEPETIYDKYERLKEAIAWEKQAGPLGDFLASDQQSAMDAQLEQLDKTIAMLGNPELTAAQREMYLDNFSHDVESIHAGIAAHREMLDTWTDRITTVVGFIVGVAVTILTFGAAGLVLAAVLGSILATASTIALKAVILGAAYGWEDIYTDIAVGIIDAVTAAATAGMGEKLLGPLKKAAAPAVSRFAFGRTVQTALRTGGKAAFLNPAESALARAIPKSSLLEAMAKRGGIPKILAIGMAEGAENLVANIPSALATSALDDNNYKEGNFITNILAGTAKQAGMSAGMGLAMKPVMKGTGAVFEAAGRVKDAAFKGQAAPRFDSFEVMRRNYPEMTVEEYGTLRAMHETQMEMQERAVRASRTEAGEASDRARDPAREAEAGVESKERVPVPDNPAARREPDLVTHRAMDEGQVRDLLPTGMRETLNVTVDLNASANSVRVERVKRLGVIVGVKLVVGPSVRPMDVLRHLGTVHSMQRYIGVTGSLVRAVEYARSWFVKNGPPPFGTKAWEAWHELHKLPAMLEDRFELLRTGGLDPKAKEAIFADIDRLSKHIDGYRKTLEIMDVSEGVGHIAAPGDPAPAPAKKRETARANRQDPAHERFDAMHSAAENSAELKKKYTKLKFLQIGRGWKEPGPNGVRTYRVLEITDPATNRVVDVYEEIRSLNASKKREVNHWVKRGQEGNITGEIGEEAFRIFHEHEQASSRRTGERLLPSDVIQRGGGQGFDGCIVKFDTKGQATIILVEVKNYPGRYVPKGDITAIRGNLTNNLKHLRGLVSDPISVKRLGLSPTEARAMVDAIDKKRLEFELHPAGSTKIGDLKNPRSSVLRSFQEEIAGYRNPPIPATDVRAGRGIDEPFMAIAKERVENRRAIAESDDLNKLMKTVPASRTTEDLRVVTAALTAQQRGGTLITPPLGRGTTPNSFVDNAKNPFVVFAPDRGASVSKLSRGIGETLVTTHAAGGNPTRIVIDESNLSVADRAALHRDLRQLAARRRYIDLGLIVLVDSTKQTATRLTPKGP